MPVGVGVVSILLTLFSLLRTIDTIQDFLCELGMKHGLLHTIDIIETFLCELDMKPHLHLC